MPSVNRLLMNYWRTIQRAANLHSSSVRAERRTVVGNAAAETNDPVMDRNLFNQWFDDRMAQRQADHVPSMTIIATKGTLDMAYPPFILASTASALGWDVLVFYTFYGLNLLRKDLDLEISPLGNPAMPMKMPMGPDWLREMNMNIPNIIMANL